MNTTTNPTARKADFSILYLEQILLLMVAICYFVIRSKFNAAPMERDEGIYSYFGHLILDGKVPYVDFYESRLPGIFYMYAFLIAIFGDFEGLAQGITLLNIGSFLFLYYAAKIWFDEQKSVALLVGICALFLGLSPEISGFTRQSEHIVVFWAMGGLFFLQKSFQNHNWRYLLAAGVFMCLSMLTKPNGVFFILMGGFATVVFYAFKDKEEGENWVKNILIKGLTYSAGVFGIFGLLCAYMAMKGALSEMFYWTISYSADYASRIPWIGENGQLGGIDYLRKAWAEISKNYLLIWVVAAQGLGLFMLVKDTAHATAKKINLFLIAIFSFLTIVPSFSFYGHYWIMLMPAVAFCFGAAAYVVYNLSNKNQLALVFASVALGFSLVVLVRANGLSGYYLKPNLNKIISQTYGGNPFNEALEIGKFLKQKRKDGDQLALIGSEPELFIYADMPSVSKHAYFSYLMNDTTSTKALIWQKEFEKDIVEKKPRFVVFFNHDISILANPKGNFIWLNNLLSVTIPQLYKPIAFVDMLGSTTPRYVFSEAELQTYRPAQSQNPQQRIYTATIFELK